MPEPRERFTASVRHPNKNFVRPRVGESDRRVFLGAVMCSRLFFLRYGVVLINDTEFRILDETPPVAFFFRGSDPQHLLFFESRVHLVPPI